MHDELTYRKKSLLIFGLGSGFLGVLSISLNVLRIVPLHISAMFIVLPFYFIVILLGIKNIYTFKNLIRGFLFGIIAVACYDLTRLPFIFAGWNDFIPSIGEWLFRKEEVTGFIGYLWRYFLNGGGLGLSFISLVLLLRLKLKIIVVGFFYGIFVFVGLIITLLLAPSAQEMMFKISTISFYGGLLGHITYGLVLGLLTSKLMRIKAMEDKK